MKKSFIWLAIGMTLPFLLSNIYSLIMYGNANGIGMGGLEVLMFWGFIALPLFIICIIILQVKLNHLKRNKLPSKEMFASFLVTFIILLGLGIGLFMLQDYCFKNRRTEHACNFLPNRSY